MEIYIYALLFVLAYFGSAAIGLLIGCGIGYSIDYILEEWR